MVCRYKDYVMTESGLQYTDLKEGTGETPKLGDTVVIDWDGYTIGEWHMRSGPTTSLPTSPSFPPSLVPTVPPTPSHGSISSPMRSLSLRVPMRVCTHGFVFSRLKGCLCSVG
jgi:hypothetical protein